MDGSNDWGSNGWNACIIFVGLYPSGLIVLICTDGPTWLPLLAPVTERKRPPKADAFLRPGSSAIMSHPAKSNGPFIPTDSDIGVQCLPPSGEISIRVIRFSGVTNSYESRNSNWFPLSSEIIMEARIKRAIASITSRRHWCTYQPSCKSRISILKHRQDSAAVVMKGKCTCYV